MSSKHSGLETTITLCLSLMIIVTIIGNILVCLSVVLVRKLRSPSNYLLVSLAISDLCVAILVMPLALNLEVKGYWDLGPTLCDMWVSFDVTSCTASILNLCMISVDRYLTITKPLTYGVKRTTKRMTCFIAIVWVSSCLISVPPLLVLGNEHGTDEEPSCQVSQHIVYQLYATLGAFYIPLGVMIILYYKIYGAAKSVVDAELRSLGHTTERLVNPNTNNNNNNNNNANFVSHQSTVHSSSTVYHQQHSYTSRYFPAIKPLLKSTLTASNKSENCSKSSFPSTVNYDHVQQPLESLNENDPYQTEDKITENSMFFSSPHSRHYPHPHQSPVTTRTSKIDTFNETHFGETKSTSTSPPTSPTLVTLTKTTPRNGLINCKEPNATTLSDVLLTKESLPKNSANLSHNNNNNNNNNDSESTFHSSLLSSYKRVKESMLSSQNRSQSSSSSPTSTHHSLQSKYHCIIQQTTQGSPINSTTNNSNNNNNNNSKDTFCSNFGVRKSLGDRLSFHAALSSGTEKRRTSSMLKERKASITLGVIMTAFTACWLPFFILALLRPFSVTVNQIPAWISSLCYWLGLTNSMLNPIIYVTFHHDFRKAFRYLLCLQCSTMDFRLRERAYQSQYGINNSSDNHLHHLTSYQYYTHPGHHQPQPPSSHQPVPPSVNLSSQLSPINQPSSVASQSNPISTSWSTPSSPATVPTPCNRSIEEKKTLSLKENLIPINYSSKGSTLEPLTSSSVDERLISQQEHLLSKHTPL